MTFLIPSFLLGMFVCWLLMRREIGQLLNDKQELLNFCEQQRCQIERQQEYETHLADQLWNAEHPELEKEWPDFVL